MVAAVDDVVMVVAIAVVVVVIIFKGKMEVGTTLLATGRDPGRPGHPRCNATFPLLSGREANESDEEERPSFPQAALLAALAGAPCRCRSFRMHPTKY